MTNIEDLKETYNRIKREITERINEFREIRDKGDKKSVFRELCFCILSSGTGPAVAEKSVQSIDDILLTGSEEEIVKRLEGIHKYPEKGGYVFTTREYLSKNFNMDLVNTLSSIDDHNERRDFLAGNRDIKGIGYLQASHFLRNTGFSGYAILDKNILKSLYELGVISDTKPPSSRKRYVEKEQKMKDFAVMLEIEFDHLDLLLWYMMRGRIPR